MFAAIALLVFACTLLLGNTGVYSDDYFCNQRDPNNRTMAGFIMNRPWFPWRPLTRIVLPGLVSTLWNHSWWLHAISGVCHALVGVLVWKLMRRLTVAESVAGSVTLLWLVYPAYFEVVLWNATICTLLAVAIMLCIWHLYSWWLLKSHLRSGSCRVVCLAGFALLTFASAGFNEQPVGALLAIPAIPIVLGAAVGRSRINAAVRTILPIGAMGAGLVAYLFGYLDHLHRIGGRISRDEVQGVEGVLHRVNKIAIQIPAETALCDFARGAWRQGLDAIAAHSGASIVVGGLGTALLLAWGWRPARALTQQQSSGSVRQIMGLALLGILWAVGAWIPVAFSYMTLWPRLHYVPSIGLAIVASAICLAALRWSRQVGSLARLVTVSVLRVGVVVVIGLAVVCWVGLQSDFKKRAAADSAEMRPLAEISRVVEPGTYFIPVRVNSDISRTNAKRLDQFFRHGWYWQFSAGWRFQWAASSTRVFTVATNEGVPICVDETRLDEFLVMPFNLVRPKDASPPATVNVAGRRQVQIRWDRVVLFEVTEAGVTRVFTNVRIVRADGSSTVVVPRQIQIAGEILAMPEREFVVREVPR
jgi:hypothetical protein